MKTISYTILFFIGLALLFRCTNYDNHTLVKKESASIRSRIELGKKLFFDKNLSIDRSISCANCHQPNLAFTDGEIRSKGIKGRLALRNAPNLFHLSGSPFFMMDGGVPTLEQQVLVPIQDPNEMGATIKLVIERLRSNTNYSMAAKKHYQREFDAFVLTRSLAAYLRTIKPKPTKFDLFWKGDNSAFNAEEKLGFRLFTQKFSCNSCHKLPFFTNYALENNGATRLDSSDLGRYRIDGKLTNIGKFKVPSLRGIAKTAPYMHNGSLHSLEVVIDRYSSGGLKVKNKSTRIKAFEISDLEKKALVQFLKTL